jgi:hypothetical protein
VKADTGLAGLTSSFDRAFNQLKACLIFSANALKGWRVMR